jgi:SAM-dependent methyltransferase
MTRATSSARAGDRQAASVDGQGVHLPDHVGSAVDVHFDGRRIWSLRPGRDTEDGTETHCARWPEALLPYLDGHVRIRVEEHGGGAVYFDDEVRFGTSHERIRLTDKDGHLLAIGKLGFISQHFADADERQRSAVVRQVNEVLALLESCGVDAFVSHGCLLGAVRDGRLIGHDCDADVTVLSRYTDPVDVAREAYALQAAFRSAGFVTHHYFAGDFKVVAPSPNGGPILVDVFSAFYVDDTFYMMPFVSGELPREALLPLTTVTLEGIDVAAPADPVAVTALTYGPEWRIPDPTFRHTPAPTTQRRLNGWMRGERAHRGFWDQFYARGGGSVADPPSPFAHWVRDQVEHGTTIVDVGSGTGRDSLWFAAEGFTVLGLEYSPPAITGARRAAAERGLTVEFRPCNLYDLRDALVEGARVAHRREPVAIYARFLLQAIEEHGRSNLWEFARTALSGGGRMFLEFRTRRDAATQHVFGDHPRHFFDPHEIVSELAARGATVDHIEEGRGRAGYQAEDPHVARLVVRWAA